jgi:hypothetical protein
MRIEIDLRIKQRASELLGIRDGMPFAQLMGVKLGVILRDQLSAPVLWISKVPRHMSAFDAHLNSCS